MKWLLHIGTTKTGSKAIQRLLAAQADTLTEPRIAYPKTGRSGVWHEDLFYALEGGRTAELAGARKEAQATGADHAVLSYEGFYQLPVTSIRLIRESLGEARILLFIRRQDMHANSWYNQLIKAHRIPFSAVVAFERHSTNYDPTLDHWATLEKWSAVFGRDAIRPVVYDKSQSSVRALFEALDVEPPADHTEPDNPNPALTPDQAATLRAVKELVGNSPELPHVVELFHRRFSSAFADTLAGDPVWILEPSACRTILEHYSASNERVRRHWFPQLDTLFAPTSYGTSTPLVLSRGMDLAQRFLREHFPKGLPGDGRTNRNW